MARPQRAGAAVAKADRPPRPQPGPQRRFLASLADIAIYGGAAGGGKTWALLLQALPHEAEPDFSAVFFRRTTMQVRHPGGLWDESFRLYAARQAQPFTASLEWRFPSGARVRFAHLEHDKTVLEWQGAQLPLIAEGAISVATAKLLGETARVAASANAANPAPAQPTTAPTA